jgi:glycosyltransferase involved in cell wall biosynthesis
VNAPAFDASVVIPAYQAEATLGECLAALDAQSLPRDRYEIIVVDDGSRDRTGEIARSRPGVRVVRQENRGAAAARNHGWRIATGTWIAFIDADCVPSRGWIAALLRAVRGNGSDAKPALGAAGKTLGLGSATEAARFADLIGSLDAERYLAHPRWPFAPSCNLLYRRDALAACDGFDERFVTYEACDLHTRLREADGGSFVYVPHAVVFHRHRATWRAYWRQQRAYGIGYAQFVRRRAGEIPWSAAAELRAWGAIVSLAASGLVPALARKNGDEHLVRRGQLVKALAQRIGFDSAYWRTVERRRWES